MKPDNRGKRSVVLDLKTPEGAEALDKLLARADVFLSNYRQRALRDLGMGFAAEQVLSRHPHLIVCPVTGFGRSGPEADRAGYDVAAFWARRCRLFFPHTSPSKTRKADLSLSLSLKWSGHLVDTCHSRAIHAIFWLW